MSSKNTVSVVSNFSMPVRRYGLGIIYMTQKNQEDVGNGTLYHVKSDINRHTSHGQRKV